VTAELVYRDDMAEVWCGDSLDPATAETVMQGRVADLLHVDAPYSERTHAGHDANAGGGNDGMVRVALSYASWAHEDVRRFCAFWLPSVRGWVSTITDHVLIPAWEAEWSEGSTGLLVFPPLPWVETGSRVRLTGDGPSGWACHLLVARPRALPWSKWGTLPGAYIQPSDAGSRPDRITGGKGLQNTRAFIADYSKRGQIVLDPCAGGGTTLIGAKQTGRRAIGIEKDHGRAELCARLLRDKREQRDLFDIEVTP
jgi:site-specific DNA-methyltransferase (adenine-specific)